VERYVKQISQHGIKWRNAYRILVRKSEGKRSLWRPTCRYEDNIWVDLREIGWEGVDWIHVTQNRDKWWALVNT